MKKLFAFIIIGCFFGIYNLLAQTKKVVVKQYASSEEVEQSHDIDFDMIRNKMPRNKSISIFIFRTESTHPNSEFITPIDSFIVPYDTSLVHLYSFELMPPEGANNCSFHYQCAGRTGYSSRGNPPFFCLTTPDTVLLNFIRKELNLNFHKDNRTYLVLKKTYGSEQEFFPILNDILNKYNTTLILKYQNAELKKRLDIMEKKLSNTRNTFIAFNYTLPLNKSVIKSGVASSSMELGKLRTSGIQFELKSYPFKNKHTGYFIGLSYNNFSGKVSSSKNVITDTIDRRAYDSKENYIRIAYGKGITENFSMLYKSLIFAYSFRVPNRADASWSLAINPGIKISDIITSKYYATDGTISWGGFYPERYNKNDTILSGQFDFYQNQPIYKEKKNLELKNTFISGYIAIEGFWAPAMLIKNPKFSLNAGIQYEHGTNILDNSSRESVLPYTIGDYNSLLYRSRKISLNVLSIKFGLAYKL